MMSVHGVSQEGSQEVLWRLALDLSDPRPLGRRMLKLHDSVVHVLVNIDDGRLVAAPVSGCALCVCV